MRRSTSYAAVGLFVILLGLTFVAGVLYIAVGEPGVRYHTYITDMEESVTGLVEDASVKYRGMDVGRVTEILLSPEDSQKIRLIMEVQADTPVKTDSVAVLEFQGLTGVAHVNLTGGSRESPLLKPTSDTPRPHIESGPSLLVRLDQGISRLIESLTVTSDQLHVLLDEENLGNVRETLASIRRLSDNLAESSQELDTAIRGASRTFDNLATASEDAGATLEELRAAATSFERMSDDLGETSQALRRAVEQGSDRVGTVATEADAQVRQLSTELRRLTERVNRAIQRLEQDPASVLHGRSDPEPGPGEGGER